MNYGLVNRPRSGATLKVWEVADEITRTTGRLARRKEVVDRITSEGGNGNTASTQYYYWKMSQTDAGDEHADVSASGNGFPLRLDVGPRGELRLPAQVLQALDVQEGGHVLAYTEDHGVRLIAAREGLRDAQAIAQKYRPATSVVESFLAERRASWGEE